MKNVVTVGGGTGSYGVLAGLKNLPDISISAIVSMADDGGTNGMLRKELGVLPPSDIRQCLVALSDSDELMNKFMRSRFTEGPLAGHSAGSIFLTGLEKITGNFSGAIKEASKILKIKAMVIPVSLDNAELSALLTTGQKVEGESKVSNIDLKISDVKKIFYKNKVELNPTAREAILKADYIIICPGDFYTSIVPNLIVSGFKETLARSKAKIIAVENLNKSDKEYRSKLEFYLGKPIDNFVQSDKSLISKESIVKDPADTIERSTIRHDPQKLVERIKRIINK